MYSSSNWSNGMTEMISQWHSMQDSLESISARFKRVYLECRTFQDVIKQHDSEDTLFSCDPTYLDLHYENHKPYKHVMSEDDHIELLDILNRIKGKAILFGHETDLYKKKLKNWVCISGMKREKIWVNFPVNIKEMVA